ncbi:acyltransferase ChoActase COT CPT [Coniophora puteana RWD-64-598 SS2]|uniref:Acyltransferase ChoActase COT CPT n=1 Tax=Coniophora puteana (strain RWD-64-598) TaxID=741705 RepID=A0A5M3MYT9_CONPW|nr:acyltransferase ChoActase COT CPT [Coniophora puteana RWD-64-598 SS2]EIW84318.1 acyltransferase ChoActase COT CPT [Coniophora puteana RWD-64-598 SS2]
MSTAAPLKAAPKLPRLPVPELSETLGRYLDSLKPFLHEQEARGGQPFEKSFAQRMQWAKEFENGIGQKCQERLHALDRASPHNWLDDNIWLKYAYLQGRDPLVVNSNWWLAFLDDSNIPKALPTQGVSPWQVRRAAWLVHRCLEYREKLLSGGLEPDASRTGIWLRENVDRMFNNCRIPLSRCDALIEKAQSPASHQILVMLHDFMYAVTVTTPEDPLVPLPFEAIEQRLGEIVVDVQRRVSSGERAVPVGVLTADQRDRWAENCQYLRNISPVNRTSLNIIEQSLFLLSLDHYTHSSSSSSTKSASSSPSSEIDDHLHHIRSSHDARNRWFDKTITLIVDSSARAGAMGEHSPCDALIPSIVAEYACVENVPESPPPPLPSSSASSHRSQAPVEQYGWAPLPFVTDLRIEHACTVAQDTARALIADSDDSVLWFEDYGSDWMKFARQSPDAYVQLALQLAWYRSRGSFTATYETVLTRMFDHGRTETIRSYTAEGREWVLSMRDKHRTERQSSLLSRAVQAHVKLTRMGATGRGIDRHLLGLRLMLRADKGERADLFEDEFFSKSQEWKLSTSGLSAGHYFKGTGFGAAYQDGYGINYLIAPSMIKFCIESKFSSADTSTTEFKSEITQALADMKSLCNMSIGTPTAHSRDNNVSARL